MESVAELLKWVLEKLELLGSHNLYGYREFYSLPSEAVVPPAAVESHGRRQYEYFLFVLFATIGSRYRCIS